VISAVFPDLIAGNRLLVVSQVKNATFGKTVGHVLARAGV
jgi:hypothetical protein